MNKRYCRVVDGKVTEAFVTEDVIAERGHPLDWYVPILTYTTATVPDYHVGYWGFYIKPEGIDAKRLHRQPTITEALNFVWQDPQDAKLRREHVIYTDIPSELLKVMETVIKTNVQVSLDRFAKARGYDSAADAIKFVGSHVANFDREARVCRYLTAQAWSSLYAYLSKVASGELPVPANSKQILDQLPALNWDVELPEGA